MKIYMGFETFPSNEPTGHGYFDPEHLERSYELLGGPFKPNDLVTTKLGLTEARPILDQLSVICKITLSTREVPLLSDVSPTAFAPAEYRITIMDPIHPDQPGSEQYVQSIVSALKEARVPVERGLSEKGPGKVNESAND
jgi:hypothetical protein